MSQATTREALAALVEKLRPLTAYGLVGTRDVDQAEHQRNLDAIVAALADAPAVPVQGAVQDILRMAERWGAESLTACTDGTIKEIFTFTKDRFELFIEDVFAATPAAVQQTNCLQSAPGTPLCDECRDGRYEHCAALAPTPQAPQPTDLHAAIMNLPCGISNERPASSSNEQGYRDGYVMGFHVARHAAAELVAASQLPAQAPAVPLLAKYQEVIDAHTEWLTTDTTGKRFIDTSREFKAMLIGSASTSEPAPQAEAVQATEDPPTATQCVIARLERQLSEARAVEAQALEVLRELLAAHDNVGRGGGYAPEEARIKAAFDRARSLASASDAAQTNRCTYPNCECEEGCETAPPQKGGHV